MEAIREDFSKKGVRFVYVYKSLAHPEWNGYVDPETLDERLKHIEEARKTLKTKFEWICDSMDNRLKKAFGGRPNSEFIIDPNGRIVIKRQWSDPQQTREDLKQLVGEPETETNPFDIEAGFLALEREIASGVVPRSYPPSGARALKTDVISSLEDHPYYVKLRAQAEPSLVSQGKGSLYIGFFLDPIYKVHWNNLTDPPSFTLHYKSKVGEIVILSGTGPKIKEPADLDPREFLFDINDLDPEYPIKLSLKYFACDDAETFCIPVAHQFNILMEIDGEAGRVIRRNPGGFQRNSNRGGFSGLRVLEALRNSDKNNDGFVDWDEAPTEVRRNFIRLDLNEDFSIDQKEVSALETRLRRR